VLDAFGISPAPKPDLSAGTEVVRRAFEPDGEVRIAIVGKYTELEDAYKSLNEALTHGGIANHVKVRVEWLDAEIFEREDPAPHLEGFHGILVPGGFGERGAEGKINACPLRAGAQDPLSRHLPRHADGGDRGGAEPCGDRATRASRSSTRRGRRRRRFEPVVYHMSEWVEGNRTVRAQVRRRQGRHHAAGRLRRHPGRRARARRRSMARARSPNATATATRSTSPTANGWRRRAAVFRPVARRRLPEIMEIPDHPWFIGVQFHPELKSKPFDPHPLFASFIGAAVKQSRLV
jgi:CTP synthase